MLVRNCGGELVVCRGKLLCRVQHGGVVQSPIDMSFPIRDVSANLNIVDAAKHLTNVEQSFASKFPKNLTRVVDCDDGMIVGDRFGDVYFTKAGEEEHSFLLGHLGAVTSIEMVSKDSKKYLITADADSKIRVSKYPEAYCIHSYCLGHESVISFVKLLGADYIVSAALDGSIRTWDWHAGHEIDMLSLDEKEETDIKFVDAAVRKRDNSWNLVVLAREWEYLLEVDIGQDGHFTGETRQITIPEMQNGFSCCVDDEDRIWIGTDDKLLATDSEKEVEISNVLEQINQNLSSSTPVSHLILETYKSYYEDYKKLKTSA